LLDLKIIKNEICEITNDNDVSLFLEEEEIFNKKTFPFRDIIYKNNNNNNHSHTVKSNSPFQQDKKDEEINFEENQKFKKGVISNLKNLYEKESFRSKKRSEQIKRIKSSRSVTSVDFDNFNLKKLIGENHDNTANEMPNLSITSREKWNLNLYDIKKIEIEDNNIKNNEQTKTSNQFSDNININCNKTLNNINISETDKSNVENSNNISNLNITYINNQNGINKENKVNENINNVNIKNNKLLILEEKQNLINNNYFQKRIKNDDNTMLENIEKLSVKDNIIKYNKNNTNSNKNPNAILNVSDLEVRLEEDENNFFFIDNENNKNLNNILILKNLNNKNTSFIDMKNNLKTKTDLQDNITQSYLMALHGYVKNSNEEEQEVENNYSYSEIDLKRYNRNSIDNKENLFLKEIIKEEFLENLKENDTEDTSIKNYNYFINNNTNIDNNLIKSQNKNKNENKNAGNYLNN